MCGPHSPSITETNPLPPSLLLMVALPFVRMFYGRPSEYLWEDDSGTVHRIPQGEGGERQRCRIGQE